MNEIQFKKLVDDYDLILDEDGFFFVEFGKKTRFNLSDSIYDYLSQVFNWYSLIGIDEFKEHVEIRLKETYHNDVNEKVVFLKEKIKNEFLEFDSLIKSNPLNQVNSVDDLKNYWFLTIENEYLLNIVTYLKFSVFNGDVISKDSVFNIDYYLFENFFFPEKLNDAYKGMRIPLRINFLQSLIDETKIDNSLKGKRTQSKKVAGKIPLTSDEKLKILLEKEFIRINDFISDEYEFYYENKSYLISKIVVQELEKTFLYYLNQAASFSIPHLEREFESKQKFFPNTKESRINILNDLVLLEKDKLIYYSGGINQYYDRNRTIAKWKNIFTKNGEHVIDLIYGLMMETNGEQSRIANCFYEYFYDDEIEKIFYVYEADKSIEYLKKRVQEIENQKNEILPAINNKTKRNDIPNKFSYKEIAIAFLLSDIHINKGNATGYLKKYSDQINPDVEQMIRVRNKHRNIGEMTKLTEIKHSDTKHLNCLKGAERLICLLKSKKGKTEITRIITAFERKINISQ